MITTAPHRSITACRSCGAGPLETLMAFGQSPLADRLTVPGGSEPEYRAPLTLCHCPACSLCQLRETVEPDILFHSAYPYFSSVSPALVAHFTDSAQCLIDSFSQASDVFVVEAASNDGTMLAPFQAAGHRVLGIDPAAAPVAEARRKGIPTDQVFFTAGHARHIRDRHGPADLFIANNVLAHVADVNDFVAGIAILLKDQGCAVIEVPSLMALVDDCAFDTIYHQHLLYLSLTALAPLFSRHGLVLTDAEKVWVHGGSFRLRIARHGAPSARLLDLMAEEARRDMGTRAFFDPFLQRIRTLCDETRAAVTDLANQGMRIAAYGAAAKGTTLLHMLDLPAGALRHVYDKSPWKAGKAMPGSGLVIRPAPELSRDDVDAVLLLAWNFADEILSENRRFLEAGGQFLIPVPKLRHVRRPAP